MIIDTHAHLDDERYDTDFSDILKRMGENEIEKVIIPGADINNLKKAQNLAKTHENLYFAAGVHPYDIADFDIEILREVAKNDEKCVAIGECGLDYFRLKDEFDTQEKRENEKKLQKEAFLAQIALAKELNKPLIVHIREANEDSFEILRKSEVSGVLHCFNASKLLLNLKDRFYFGIGGVLTFKNAKNLVEILPEIPLDRLLIETDAPYLTPEPFRGKRNEPSYTKFVVQKVSEILNMPVCEVENITTQNAKRLFKF